MSLFVRQKTKRGERCNLQSIWCASLSETKKGWLLKANLLFLIYLEQQLLECSFDFTLFETFNNVSYKDIIKVLHT